ncbi:DUF4382 domain-containing protein [Halieaceae bacterium IMCC14734]|uniref:DUF4382 domain-containing protein n=1 Tax=Candidatus Litorirhabdus singularis TaxID=2518993 RepID=A0ABT3TDS6_9GAMM|nr:DUF4382 domain-containing protein [Candidatus Litorirhabdus singularis]MCX2980418.1 DUF4382 domain-containing protein [Candidatus Litorirhabdus singularis]
MKALSSTTNKRPYIAAIALTAALSMVQLAGCGCGFDCSSEDSGSTPTGALTLGISDAPLDEVSEVVVVIDQVVLRGSGINDVIIDVFTQNAAETDTISVDLMQYPGLSQLIIIDALELVAGTYTAVELVILDGDVNFSYVVDIEGQKPLEADSSRLLLPGISIGSGTEHSYTLEFELGQSLSSNADGSSYQLSAQGVRVIDTTVSASVGGSISTDLFSEGEVCSAKLDPLVGNRVYLYNGHNLVAEDLADVHTTDSSTTVPTAAIAPLALTQPRFNDSFARWDYIIAYLPAGDYTLALSCAAEDDDPINYDGFALPAPAAQLYEITVAAGDSAICNLTVAGDCQ